MSNKQSKRQQGNGKKDKGRFSSKRKTEVVLRLLRGEDLETLSREYGVTAARISEWRDEFLAAGEAGLKGGAAQDSRDEQIRQLQAKVGELTMDLEASREAVSRLKEGRPLGPGRPS